MFEVTVMESPDSIKERAEKVFDMLDVSDGTRLDYRYRIGLFLEYMGKHGFNVNSFLEFKRYLSHRGDMAVATKNKYLITAKVFLKELNRQGILPADITQNIKVFAQSKKHKREGITDEEMAVLTEHMRNLPCNPQNDRLKAILSLLSLQGLREIEVVRLDVKDIDFAGKVAFIHGKGKDDKEAVYLHPETVTALKTYMKSNKVADRALFVSQSNNSVNKRLTTRGLRAIVSTKLNEVGIEKAVHGFRHYFTTRLINVYKGDLLEVARFTRHRGLEMLQVYNDNIKQKADLPRFFSAFDGVSF